MLSAHGFQIRNSTTKLEELLIACFHTLLSELRENFSTGGLDAVHQAPGIKLPSRISFKSLLLPRNQD